ncbi:hypothetical protein JFK97_19145 [Chromobacterium phragmitis]|uniref:hypothetical protein n=1 Tax=Chromobacterium amazonense TaxID=1382803 RepID=UPI0021B6F7D7|nr:hypothetical protein [Chromobacterium amazonense]MBM2886510.1 hypothetical protein [Chromobacterium amazonense]
MQGLNEMVTQIINKMPDLRPLPPSAGMLLVGKLQGIYAAPPEKRGEMLAQAWAAALEENAQARGFFRTVGADERLAQLWAALTAACIPGWLAGIHGQKQALIDSAANAFDARQNSLIQYLEQQLAHADMKELEKAKGIELAASLGRLLDAVGPNFTPPPIPPHELHLAQPLSPVAGAGDLARAVTPAMPAPMASVGPFIDLGG